MSDVVIRPAERRDLEVLLDIYNHYVVNTPITFDIEPRTLEQRQEWFRQFATTGRYRCFVVLCDGRPLGWASSVRFKERAAYDPSVETSVYLAPSEQRKGLGRLLYAALFEALATEDVHRAFAGVTLPNEASVGLHRAFGFEPVGIYREVGRKFGRFWDVGWYQKTLS
jgi:phosphinothricin acetyltransferase